jgi:hypothetical protein
MYGLQATRNEQHITLSNVHPSLHNKNALHPRQGGAKLCEITEQDSFA